VKRREFISVLSCFSALAFTARAQQKLPVIGFLNANPEGGVATAFRKGLSEHGYVAGRDFVSEYRGNSPYGPDQHDRIAADAAALVERGAALIVVYRVLDALIAKAATKSIPIVFSVGGDPVATGLVDSLAHPGGNLTGNANLNTDLIEKRLEILHELAPAAASVGFIANPTNTTYTAVETKQLQRAARALGLRLLIADVASPGDLDPAFAGLARDGASALVVSGDALFYNIRDQLNVLIAHYAWPAIYATRAWATAGSLVSYGTDYSNGYHLMGIYAGRILKGEKPADLPVQQITKIELVINLKAAKTLGITIPSTLLARADEVIE